MCQTKKYGPIPGQKEEEKKRTMMTIQAKPYAL